MRVEQETMAKGDKVYVLENHLVEAQTASLLARFRNNTPFQNVSKQFGVTASALFRHKKQSPLGEKIGKFADRLTSPPP